MKRLIYFICLLIACITLSFEASRVLNPDDFIQKVKIEFLTPDNYSRQLLLGFTSDNVASDSYDYGYDSKTADEFHNDLNWLINGERYVIQGVGEFSEDKFYSLGMFLRDSGTVKISLYSLENFDSGLPVYIYDAYHDIYTNLNDMDYEAVVDGGNYMDRYYIAFSTNSVTLSNENKTFKELFKVFSNNKSSDLWVKTNDENPIDKIIIYGVDGKRYYEATLNSNQWRINTVNINTNLLFIEIYTNNGIFMKKVLIP